MKERLRESLVPVLSRDDCQIMKGLAILCIVIHNVCHWSALRQGTNEFGYWQACADLLRDYLGHIDGNWLVVLMSFLGQYGVQTFIFLSAYGLVRKYEQGSGTRVGRLSFMGEHYVKLFRLMIVAFVATFFIALHCGGRGFDPAVMTRWQWWVPQVLMINNLLPDPTMNIFPGPFWYLGLMVELYVIYALFLWVKPGERWQWRGFVLPVLFMAVCVWPQVNLDLETQRPLLIRLRYNFFMAGIPFGAGLLTARYVRLVRLRNAVLLTLSHVAWALVAVLAMVAFVLMQFTYVQWLWSGLLFTLSLAGVARLLGPYAGKPLVWVGVISSAVFVTHPALRLLATNFLADGNITDPVLIHKVVAVYTVACLLVGWAYNLLLRLLPSPRWVSRYNGKLN